MMTSTKLDSNIKLLILTAIIFSILYFIQLGNYLLFHLFAEIFSIVIAFSVFIIVWNGRSYLKDNYLLLYGIAYLFIGFIDLLHTFGYKGMSIFRDYDYYANQFWIAGRMIESVTLLSGSIFINRKVKISTNFTIILYTAVTVLFTYSILFSDIFPECFIEGMGQTQFKIISEYIIILTLSLTMINFIRKKRFFDKDTFIYMILSVFFTILSEFAFIFYIDNYGVSNMVGHFAKIVSFYFIYRAIIRKNIIEPHDSIFKELNEANQLKIHLFSVIAHDLTGPMAGITSIAKTVDNEFDTLQDDLRKEYISELRKALENTDMLLNNLLEWSRLELAGHKIRKQRCNPVDLINENILELQSMFDDKDIIVNIESESDVYINVDPDTFKVVMRNILSNALKFSDKSGEIRVVCENAEDDIVLSVIDNGRGMIVDQRMLQSPLNKSSRGTSGEKGVGLGLYLIQKFTSENDGTLEILSESGKGTTVRLRFDSV